MIYRTGISIAFIVCTHFSLIAQQSFGVGGYFMAQKAMKQEFEYSEYNWWGGGTPRAVGHMNDLGFGFRAEANLVLPKAAMGAGFAGLGFGYFGPTEDSSVYRASALANNGWYGDILGTTKTSMFSYGLRFGYEIPQRLNDFLSIYLGAGLQLLKIKQQNIFPRVPVSGFNYTQADFDQEDFEPYKQTGAAGEGLVAIYYELEKFHISLQYSLFYPIVDDKRVGRHGVNFGIYYPLKRWSPPPVDTQQY